MSAPLCIYYRLYDLKKSVQLIVAYPSFRANLESAIRKCDFSGDILEGIENSEKIIEEAYVDRKSVV